MNHLEAFMSEDGKLEREWTDGCSRYKRQYDQLWIDAHADGNWRFCDEQVAAMDDKVTWADEPKALTPQEALRALADGKIIKLLRNRCMYRMEPHGLVSKIGGGEWSLDNIGFDEPFVVCDDPSQPAEPQSEFPPGRVINRSDIYLAMQSGAVVAPTSYDCMHLRVRGGIPQRKHTCNSKFTWNDSFNGYDGEEYGPTWRIVDGGK